MKIVSSLLSTLTVLLLALVALGYLLSEYLHLTAAMQQLRQENQQLLMQRAEENQGFQRQISELRQALAAERALREQAEAEAAALREQLATVEQSEVGEAPVVATTGMEKGCEPLTAAGQQPGNLPVFFPFPPMRLNIQQRIALATFGVVVVAASGFYHVTHGRRSSRNDREAVEEVQSGALDTGDSADVMVRMTRSQVRHYARWLRLAQGSPQAARRQAAAGEKDAAAEDARRQPQGAGGREQGYAEA